MTSRLTFAIESEKGYLCKKYSKFQFLPTCSVSLSTSLFSLLKLLTDQVVYRASLVSSVGKESAYNAGDPGSIPGSGRSTGEGNRTHSSIPTWRIPWTEEPGGLQPIGPQRVGQD